MFNSLKYAKKLEEVGLTREQAEMHVQILSEVMESTLATKQDMKDLNLALSQDMKNLNLALSQDIKDLDQRIGQDVKNLHQRIDTLAVDFRNELKITEQRMTIKIGTIVSMAIGVAVTIVKLIS
jgi:hypothetical protein